MARQPRKPPRNLAAYWQMEAFNVLLVPGLALALGFPQTLIEALAIGLAGIACGGLLVVGAAYWRGVDRHLRFDRGTAKEQALRLADRVERPLVMIGAGGGVATIAALSAHGWSRSVIAAALLTLLAALEYVNYYHRQLQHFDNAADFKRLLSGRGLKTAHMARDLVRWRGARARRDRSVR